MSKTIKIYTNLDISPSYVAENIEHIVTKNDEEKIVYTVNDEYNLPIGTYAEIRNYNFSDLEEAATVYTYDDESDPIATYCYFDEVSEAPSCEYVENINSVNTTNNNDCCGTVFIDKDNYVYNLIQIDTITSNNITLVDKMSLSDEFLSLSDAIKNIGDENPIVIDIDDLLPIIGRYQIKINSTSYTCSAFTNFFDNLDTMYFPFFEGGYGEQVTTNNANTIENYKIEHWKSFISNSNSSEMSLGSNSGTSTANNVTTHPAGNYYLTDETSGVGVISVKDINYTFYDALYRILYDYLYINEDDTGTPVLTDPSSYTFLLKSYRMYIKKPEDIGVLNPKTEYSTNVLTLDEIKTLTADEAQEYFNHTIIYDSTYNNFNKLILSYEDAYDVINDTKPTCINMCGKYFVLPDNVGIKFNESGNYNCLDISNFILEEAYCATAKKYTNKNLLTYKYTNYGNTVRVREVYDKTTDSTYIISQNGSGGFAEYYTEDRFCVIVRGASGKQDYYFFNASSEGVAAAEQFKEDLLYAIEDGPSIVSVNGLVGFYTE